LFNTVSGNIQTAVTNAIKDGTLAEVSFAPLEKKIADATEEGVKKGIEAGLTGTGTGREQQTALGQIGTSIEATPMANFQGLDNQLQAYKTPLQVEMEAIKLMFMELNESINELFEATLTDTLLDVADAIGSALGSGGNIIKNIGQSLIQSMGKLLKNLGRLYVQYGVAALDFAKTSAALASGNPATIKAAAIKLIAIGAVLSTIGSAIGSASQGGGGGGSISSGGGTTQTATSSVSSTSFQAQRESEVVFRIAGTDLLGVLRRAEGQENRLG
jgi:hypothetical protein